MSKIDDLEKMLNDPKNAEALKARGIIVKQKKKLIYKTFVLDADVLSRFLEFVSDRTVNGKKVKIKTAVQESFSDYIKKHSK